MSFISDSRLFPHLIFSPSLPLPCHWQVRAVIPRRNSLPGDRGVLIVTYAAHKKKAYSFFLVQVYFYPPGLMPHGTLLITRCLLWLCYHIAALFYALYYSFYCLY